VRRAYKRGGKALIPSQHPGQTEIPQLGIPSRIQEDVGRLDIAMQDGAVGYFVVAHLQGTAKLEEHPPDVGFLEALPLGSGSLDNLGKIAAGTALHHYIYRFGLPIHQMMVVLHNIRVLELPQNTDLGYQGLTLGLVQLIVIHALPGKQLTGALVPHLVAGAEGSIAHHGQNLVILQGLLRKVHAGRFLTAHFW